MSIKVSVVVPVYNQEAYLREALDSLVAQTLQEAEFIIVNDGSTDSSLAIIEEYAAQDNRFVVIDKANGGVGLAINTGIQAAKGAYIAELDSDDYVDPNMYANLYETAIANDVDILKSNLINFTGSGETYKGTEEKIVKDKTFYNRVVNPLEDTIVLSFPMYAWTSLYRRELLIDNNIIWNPEVSSYNDNGFFWQTMGVAKRVMYVDETYIYHRRDNEMSTVKNPDKMFTNFFVEHDFIKRDLTERGVFEEMKAHFFERKINNYYFALSVIPYEKKQEFFGLIAKDFAKDIDETGLLDIEFVNPNNKQRIFEIVQNPDLFFFSNYLPIYYKVSVVVPVHQAGEYLRSTLDGLVNQSLREIEIILIENGSTDDTVDIIQEYQKKDPRILYQSIGASNAGKARNVGMDMAHGRFIIFLDSDDEFHPDLLRRAYDAGNRHKAEVVWFNSQQKNFSNGLTKVHTHAFREERIPTKQPFAFNQIKGNPYNAFIGWPWDKLFDLQWIRLNGFRYQEQDVANDGYFVITAMSKARRIATVKDVLVTRVVGHGNNISSTRHDSNPDAQFKMIVETFKKLRTFSDEKLATDWVARSLQLINWLFTTGFSSTEGAKQYFNLLVSGGLDELELENIDAEKLSSYDRGLLDTLEKMKSYQAGEYNQFIDELGHDEWAVSQKKNLDVYPPDRRQQDRSARLIFGQTVGEGQGTAAAFLNIILPYRDTSNVTAMIDFAYMGNFKAVAKDTLNLSLSMQERDGVLTPVIHQIEWDNGVDELMNSIYFSFTGNVFTIYSKYLEQYTGTEMNIRTISSREGVLGFSTVVPNKGFKTTRFPKISPDMLPIKTVRRSSGSSVLGNRTIFRAPSGENTGYNLFALDLNMFPFNNVAASVQVSYLPNLQPVVKDTLNLGFYVNPTDDGLIPAVFQADWTREDSPLADQVYYYIEGSRLYVGVRYTHQWEGYHFKLENVVSRELGQPYEVVVLANEFVRHGLAPIPENAQFIGSQVVNVINMETVETDSTDDEEEQEK